MAQKMKLSIHLLTKNLKTYTKRTKSIIMINFFHLLNNFSLVITLKCFYFTEEKHRMLFKSYFMEAQIEEEAKKEEVVQRSEEVQTIIDRMPTRGATYAIILTTLLILIILTLGFVIKYPDSVDGQISITAHIAPVRLVANTSGKLHLLHENRTSVCEDQVIAYIDNEANYKDILLLDSLLNRYNNQDLEDFPIRSGLILGGASSPYNSFCIAHSQYYRTLHSDVYKTMCNSLQQQNEINSEIIENLNKELLLKGKKLSIEKERLTKDSILYLAKAISEQDFQRQQSTFYDLQAAYKELHSSRLSYTAQIKRNEQQIQQYLLQEQETLDKLREELSVSKSQLTNTIHAWKKQYLQISPINGQMEYLGFWRENYFVQNGQELFSILPDQNEIVGEMIVPSYGIGKVKIGQTANVKVNNYPYMEYGLIKGKVCSISRLSNKVQMPSTTQAESNVYRIIITFPNGLQTNFGKILDLDFESQGTSEIITKPKRLIERLFDNLKANAEQ